MARAFVPGNGRRGRSHVGGNDAIQSRPSVLTLEIASNSFLRRADEPG